MLPRRPPALEGYASRAEDQKTPDMNEKASKNQEGKKTREVVKNCVGLVGRSRSKHPDWAKKSCAARARQGNQGIDVLLDGHPHPSISLGSESVALGPAPGKHKPAGSDVPRNRDGVRSNGKINLRFFMLHDAATAVAILGVGGGFADGVERSGARV